MTTTHEALREAVEALKEMLAWANCKPGTYPGGYPGTKAASAIAKAEEAQKQPILAASDDLRSRCAEILKWQKTGILDGGCLREYAKAKYPGEAHALQLAEAQTAREAYGALVASPQKPPTYDTTKWRLVPTRLDERMEDAALTACGLDCIEADRLYTALLEAAPLPPEQPATEYEKQNPLGGPAKVFDAMADAIRAGDSYESVLKLYGYAEAKPSAEHSTTTP